MKHFYFDQIAVQLTDALKHCCCSSRGPGFPRASSLLLLRASSPLLPRASSPLSPPRAFSLPSSPRAALSRDGVDYHDDLVADGLGHSLADGLGADGEDDDADGEDDDAELVRVGR